MTEKSASHAAPRRRFYNVPLSLFPALLCLLFGAAGYLVPLLAGAEEEAGQTLFSALLLLLLAAYGVSFAFRAVFARRIAAFLAGGERRLLRPLYHRGLPLCLLTACVPGAAFLFYALDYGEADVLCAALAFALYLSLTAAMVSAPWFSVEEDHGKGALFFLLSLLLAGGGGAALYLLTEVGLTVSLLGGLLLGALFFALAQGFFIGAHFRYPEKDAVSCLRGNLRLLLAGFLLVLGLLTPLFVLWLTAGGEYIALIFPTQKEFDPAFLLAGLIALPTLIFLRCFSRGRLTPPMLALSTALSYGTLDEIQTAKKALFAQLRKTLLYALLFGSLCGAALLAAALYALPALGYERLAALCCPSLAAGLIAAATLFGAWNALSCVEDDAGQLLTAAVFLLVTAAGSVSACWFLPDYLAGLGLLLGAVCGLAVAYLRLARAERTLLPRCFCA